MSKSKIVLISFGVIALITGIILIVINMVQLVKLKNKERYSELPKINIVEEKLEDYFYSREPFDFIRYEIEDDILSYYFKVSNEELYFKVVYVFRQSAYQPFYKFWTYEAVVPSWKEEVIIDE